MPFSYTLGVDFTKEKFKTVTIEYRAWELEYSPSLPSLPNTLLTERQKRLVQGILRKKPQHQYNYPPTWKVVSGGAVFTLIGFFVVLFALRGTMRLFVWIVAGFKDGQN